MHRILRRFPMRSAPSPAFAMLAAAMLAALLAAPLAHAQYSWIDDNGTRVFSDRPPPPGTPANRILKAPRPSLPPDAQAPADATPAAPAPAAPPSLADRDADFRKRQAQRQADEQKARQDAARRTDDQERCQSIRQEQAQLASGARITQVGSTGERGFLTDEDRAKRMARTQQQLAECQAAAINAQ